MRLPGQFPIAGIAGGAAEIAQPRGERLQTVVSRARLVVPGADGVAGVGRRVLDLGRRLLDGLDGLGEPLLEERQLAAGHLGGPNPIGQPRDAGAEQDGEPTTTPGHTRTRT
jgi:hypothetical protein